MAKDKQQAIKEAKEYWKRTAVIENLTEAEMQRRLDDDFVGVTTRAEEVIYNQKFAGAAAGLLNANIIARDLGLSDKKDINSKNTHTHKIENLENLTDEELANIATGGS